MFNSPHPPLDPGDPEEPIRCPSCNATFLTPFNLSQHKSRYHAIPALVELPDGTFETLIIEPEGGYTCWCGEYFAIRDTTKAHVIDAHFHGVAPSKLKLFTKNSKGKFPL